MPRNPELDLRFIVAPRTRQRKMSVTCEYKSELFDATTIQQLLESYGDILKVFTGNLDTRVSSFELNGELADKAAGARSRDQGYLLSVSATFAAEPLNEPLSFWMDELGIESRIEFTRRDVTGAGLDAESGPAGQQLNVLLVRLEDWADPDQSGLAPGGDWKDPLGARLEEFSRQMESAARASHSPYLICFCPSSSEVRGREHEGEYFRRIESVLAKRLSRLRGVYTVTSSELFDHYPVTDCYRVADRRVSRSYTDSFFAALGTMIARRIYSLRKQPHKVIVLDCDGTLWEGDVEKRGPLGLKCDSGHLALQSAIVEQQKRGMLVCLCDTGSEEDVLAALDLHPEMLLKREHIRWTRINAARKPDKIRALAKELHLGLESFIVIDDDPAELAEVIAACPEVEAYSLPEDPTKIEGWLKCIWAFDSLEAC